MFTLILIWLQGEITWWRWYFTSRRCC